MRNTPDGKPLFIRKKEDGPHGRAYLAEPRGKRGKIKQLFVLVREMKQSTGIQKTRDRIVQSRGKKCRTY